MSDSEHNTEPELPLDATEGELGETVTLPMAQCGPSVAPPEIPGYQIADKLGEGGMGAVYQATQLATQREVALKVMSARAIGSEKACRRFEREVELASGLEHPNIARVYDSGLADGVYFYAMRLVPGLALDKHVRKQALGVAQILSVMGKVCRGVEFAHRKGVIHRDLKPQNIVVSEAGEPYVLDFGLAKALDDDATQLSMDGERAGTPAYMSPEQAAGRSSDIDTRTDVYALGVILYRLLLKEHPHDLSGSSFDVMRRVIAEEPKRPRAVDKNLDGDLEAILLKCLEKDPSQRYGSAGGLADDLDRYLSKQPVVARPATLGYFTRKALLRHKIAVAIAVGVLVVFAAGLIAYVRGISAEQARTELARQQAVDNETRALEEAARAARAEKEARDAEQAARNSAKEAREAEQAAKASEKLSRQRAYNNTVALAQQVALDGNATEARRLLNGCDRELRHFEWHYLNHRLTDRSRTLPGATRVDWSRGERVALLRHRPPMALVCDWFTGEKLAVFELPSPGGDVAISPNGAYLSIGGRNAAIWDIDTQLAAQLSAQDSPVHRLDWSANGAYLAGGCRDGELYIWQMPDAIEVRKISIGTMSDLAISGDGKLVLVVGPESTQLWDVDAAVLRHESHRNNTHARVAFSPDASLYVIIDGNSRITVHESATGRVLRRGQLGTNGSCNWVKWSPDGRQIAAYSNRTFLFDAETLEEVARFPGGDQDGAFSPDSRRLMVQGGPSRVFETGLAPDPVNWTGASEGVPAFSADGRWLITGDRLLDRQRGTVRTLPSPGWVDRMAFSPGGEWLAASARTGIVTVWRTETGVVQHRLA